MRRRVARKPGVVQSLGVELRVPLRSVRKERGRWVVDGDRPVDSLDEDVVGGEVRLGCQRMAVLLERDDDGHLAARVVFYDLEDA